MPVVYVCTHSSCTNKVAFLEILDYGKEGRGLESPFSQSATVKLFETSSKLYVFSNHNVYFCSFSQSLYFVLLILGPVVQSIVSLTSSLRGQLVKCFTTL